MEGELESQLRDMMEQVCVRTCCGRASIRGDDAGVCVC